MFPTVCLFLLFLMCWLSAVPEIAFVDWYLICVHCNWKQAREQASGVGVCENWDMVVAVIWKNGASTSQSCNRMVGRRYGNI